MTVTNLGVVSVGFINPAAATAVAAVSVAVDASLPTISAQLDGYIKLQTPSASFSIDAQLSVAAESYASALAELGLIPGGATLAATLTAAVAAQLAAQAAIKVAAPELALKIDAALAATAGLSAAVSAGVSGPNVDLATIALKVSEIGAFIASLEAQAQIAADLSAPLAAAGVAAYRFNGKTATLGAELGAAVSSLGVTGDTHALLLVATSDAAWGGLSATLKTS